MQIKCEYCDSYYDDDEEKCPYCGATNEHLNRTAKGVPQTIEDLKDYCSRHNIPTKKLRLFIGENYIDPKAYGIYQDGERFIVYKNKADGSRAVRYDGTDESYAVNELYQKIRERAAGQAENNPDFRRGTGSDRSAAHAEKVQDVCDRLQERMERRHSRRRRHNRIVLIILLIWLLISIGSSCARSFRYTVTYDNGISIHWGIGGDDYDYYYDDDDYDDGYDYDYDYDYDDDWDDDWDDYDYDWDDWDDSWDDWDSDW